MIWIYAKKAEGNSIRAQRAASRELLRYAVMTHFGREIDSLEFAVKANGKPVFAGDAENIHFNISHAGEYSVCAVGDEESGIDLEVIRPIRERVCVRYLGGYVEDASEQIRRWTQRESLGKYTGTGFYGDNSAVLHKYTEYEFVSGYILTLCTAPKTNPPEKIVFI